MFVGLIEQGGNSEIHVYKTEAVLKNQALMPKTCLSSKVTQVSFGNLNKFVYVSSLLGTLSRIVPATGEQEKKNKIHNDAIMSFTFSPDRLFLFTCSRDETYAMVDPESLEKLYSYNFHGNISRSLAISPLYLPDSKPVQRFHVLVGGGQDEKEVTTTRKKGGFEIKLVNYITNEELAEIKGHFGPVHSLSFSPDGKTFASGSEDGFVRLHTFQPEYYTYKLE